MSISLLEPSRWYTASVRIAYNETMLHLNIYVQGMCSLEPRDYV